MKYFKTTYITFLIILSSIACYGQKTYLDSVSVEIEGKIELGMSIYDYSDLVHSVENDLKNLHDILKGNQDIPEPPYSISYKPNKKLSIKQSGPAERIIWKNGKQTRYQFNNKCEILSDKYQLHIEYNEIESLVSADLIEKLKEVIDTTSTIQGRFSKIYNYSFIEGNLVHNKQLDEQVGKTDMLFIKGGVGASLIKNQPVIDLAAEIGLGFGKKGILKNQFYLSYTPLFDFVDNSTIDLNHFVNLGYRYNLSKNKNDSNWLGLELGYLVSQEGDLFNEDTFKIGVNWEVGKYISISPQLYVSKELTYPAVRVGFGF